MDALKDLLSIMRANKWVTLEEIHPHFSFPRIIVLDYVSIICIPIYSMIHNIYNIDILINISITVNCNEYKSEFQYKPLCGNKLGWILLNVHYNQ